jgi:uncharacterized membrane protein
VGFFTYGGSYFGIVLFLLGGKLEQKRKKEIKKEKKRKERAQNNLCDYNIILDGSFYL